MKWNLLTCEILHGGYILCSQRNFLFQREKNLQRVKTFTLQTRGSLTWHINNWMNLKFITFLGNIFPRWIKFVSCESNVQLLQIFKLLFSVSIVPVSINRYNSSLIIQLKSQIEFCNVYRRPRPALKVFNLSHNVLYIVLLLILQFRI